MELRQKINIMMIIFFSFLAFASYHKGTGSVAWMQYTTLVTFLFFGLVFDMTFTNDSNFIFDPDADNWRRKTEAGGF